MICPNLLAKATERASRVIGLRSNASTLVLLLAAMVPSTTQATLGVLAGSGSSSDPYEVVDYADLSVVATGSYARSAHYRLMADIDATPSDTADARKGFKPISFSGKFHGGGHKISTLSIHRSGQDAGLFSVLDSSAVVDSLELVGASISGSRHVGALAATNFGTILVCVSSGAVVGDTATGHVGGLVGTNRGMIRSSRSSSKDSGHTGILAGGLVGWNAGSIESSHATGTVTAGHHAGGLVGVNLGTLHSSTATGAISGSNPNARYGGLVGSTTAGRIHDCKATGAVEANGDSVALGGLAGLARDTRIDSSHATGGITAHADHAMVGGLVGQSGNSILRAVHATGAVTATGLQAVAGGLVGATSSGDSLGSCYATGGTTATGLDAVVGGLVGRSDSTSVEVCYATGAVTTTGTNALAGGLVGIAGRGDMIRYSYAAGPVTATGSNVFAGGLVGLNRGTVDASYAVSKVVNSESAFLPGGLVGNDSGVILASYWGLETASSTIGVGYGLSTGSATGLIAVAMALPASFVGWDFTDVWMVGNADTVPLLRALASSYGSSSGIGSRAVRGTSVYSWTRTGNKITVTVPGTSFDVVVSDFSGRILARASGNGSVEVDLKAARSAVVAIRSSAMHESFKVSALR